MMPSLTRPSLIRSASEGSTAATVTPRSQDGDMEMQLPFPNQAPRRSATRHRPVLGAFPSGGLTSIGRLDEETRRIGRAGLADARATLAASRWPHDSLAQEPPSDSEAGAAVPA